MKGFFFQHPLEYHLNVAGEEWEQGTTLNGSLLVKNIENNTTLCKLLQIVLVYGVFKKIKAKELEAWSELQTRVLAENIDFAAKEEKQYGWTFDLATDYQISDKGGSLFLLYGGENIYSQGRIDVRLKLLPMLQSFIQTFESQFRFKKKYEKSKQKFTEVKLVPPDSKEYITLDHVLCLLRVHERIMEILYTFRMKSFGRKEEHQQMKMVNKKRECQQQFTEAQYTLGGFPNRECFRLAIQEALEQIKPQVLF
jgi:hypothetical protein